MRGFTKLFLVFWMISISSSAEKSGVESLSFASAGRAHWSGKGAFKSNPAALLIDKKVSVGADYVLYKGQGEHKFRVSMTDSSTTSWGMGVAYSPIYNSSAGLYGHDLSALLAMPIVPDVFFVGVGGYYVRNSIKGPHGSLNLFNADAGLLLSTPVGLRFALVADHLLKENSHEKPLGVALGASFDFRTLLPHLPLSIHTDFAMNDFNSDADLKNELAVGIQYLALFVLPVRTGFRHENHRKENYLALGSGFSSEHFSIDGAFEQNLSRGKERYLAIGASISF